MTSEDDARTALTQAIAGISAAERALEEARDTLGEAIANAIRAGIRPKEINELVPYNREHIRRMARKHGAPLLREPTVISKRQPAPPPEATN